MIEKLIHESIASKNEYSTKIRSKNQIPFFPSLAFYYNLVKIIYKSANVAKAGFYDTKAWTKSSADIMEALENVGVKMHFSGLQYLREYREPTIFISNHMSTLETMVPIAFIEPVKPVLFVIKKELAEYPVFKHVIMSTNPIVVGRANPREDLVLVLEEGSKRLKEGRSIILFPQKTRSPIFDVSQFNTLGIKLAKRNNVTVTPMAVLTDAWSNGRFIKEFGKIDISKQAYITFGEPMKITGNGAEENEKVIQFIKDNLIKWGRKDLIKL